MNLSDNPIMNHVFACNCEITIKEIGEICINNCKEHQWKITKKEI